MRSRTTIWFLITLLGGMALLYPPDHWILEVHQYSVQHTRPESDMVHLRFHRTQFELLRNGENEFEWLGNTWDIYQTSFSGDWIAVDAHCDRVESRLKEALDKSSARGSAAPVPLDPSKEYPPLSKFIGDQARMIASFRESFLSHLRPINSSEPLQDHISELIIPPPEQSSTFFTC